MILVWHEKPPQLWCVFTSYQWFVCGQATPRPKVSSGLLKEAQINRLSSRVKKLMWSSPTDRGIEASLFTRLVQCGQSAATRSTKRHAESTVTAFVFTLTLSSSSWQADPTNTGRKAGPGFAANKMWDSTIVSIPHTSRRKCSLKGALFEPVVVAKYSKMRGHQIKNKNKTKTAKSLMQINLLWPLCFVYAGEGAILLQDAENI